MSRSGFKMPERSTSVRNKQKLESELTAEQLVRINFEVPESLRDEFKLACVSNKMKVREVLTELVEGYVKKNK